VGAISGVSADSGCLGTGWRLVIVFIQRQPHRLFASLHPKSLPENDQSEYCFGFLIDHPDRSSCVFAPTAHLSPYPSKAFARSANENRPGTGIALCLPNQRRCPSPVKQNTANGIHVIQND
jgi:hypothetical protein